MPRTYVDNAYNRRVGRVGMPVGSCVISRSGIYLGSHEYVDNYKNRSLDRVGLPRGSYPEGICSWDPLSAWATQSDKDVHPSHTKINQDNKDRTKVHDQNDDVIYIKTTKGENASQNKTKTKKAPTSLEILLDENEHLQMKLFEEQEKVEVLKNERSMLTRKLEEKEKVVDITEQAKDAFKSRLDEAERNLAAREEDLRLINIKFEDMKKFEMQMARVKEMLEDQILRLKHQMKQEIIIQDDKLALRDEIVQLRVSIGEKDEEICRLKEFIKKQEYTIKALNERYMEEKEQGQKLEDTIEALNKKYLDEKGTLKTKTIAHNRQLARYRQKLQEDADKKVKLYSELNDLQPLGHKAMKNAN